MSIYSEAVMRREVDDLLEPIRDALIAAQKRHVEQVGYSVHLQRIIEAFSKGRYANENTDARYHAEMANDAMRRMDRLEAARLKAARGEVEA